MKASVPMRIGLATHSMTALFNQEFVSKGLSYTVSSVSAKVAEDLCDVEIGSCQCGGG